jgi:hypothetical protein
MNRHIRLDGPPSAIAASLQNIRRCGVPFIVYVPERDQPVMVVTSSRDLVSMWKSGMSFGACSIVVRDRDLDMVILNSIAEVEQR